MFDSTLEALRQLQGKSSKVGMLERDLPAWLGPAPALHSNLFRWVILSYQVKSPRNRNFSIVNRTSPEVHKPQAVHCFIVPKKRYPSNRSPMAHVNALSPWDKAPWRQALLCAVLSCPGSVGPSAEDVGGQSRDSCLLWDHHKENPPSIWALSQAQVLLGGIAEAEQGGLTAER